jgi:hypothetical protein
MQDISGETLDHYLAIANKKYGDTLTLEEIKKIFNTAVTDFKEYKLHLELLGHVCDYLWTQEHAKPICQHFTKRDQLIYQNVRSYTRCFLTCAKT